MNPISIKHKQPGFTLIEILIALVLGSFLLAGIIQVFLGSKNSYRMQEDLSRMQESGRFAIEFLSQDIRMADFRACSTVASVAGSVTGTNDIANAPLTVQTDTIAVTQLSIPPAPACVALAANIASCVPDSCSIACAVGDPTAAIPILPLCPLGATSVAYSIRADATSGQPTLFKSTNGGAVQPLIEGIENMQILYGEDTDADGTPEYYVDAATVVNMNQVVSVRVTLTARSLNDNLTINVNPSGDRRLRQTYSSTIALRNRLQ